MMATHSKVLAGTGGAAGTGALGIIVVWAAREFGGVDISAEVAAAVTVIFATVGQHVAGYLKRETVYQSNPPARRISSQSKK